MNERLNERWIMDHAASLLERILILTAPLPLHLKRRVHSAIRLLRNPPTRNRGMRG